MTGLRFVWILSLLGLALGCGQEEKTYHVFVSFPHQTALADADTLKVWVVIPSTADEECSDLVTGAAFPGDEDFQIESLLTISIKSPGPDLVLTHVNAGRRLFYAEAWTADSALFYGCTERLAGQEDRSEVLIILQ